MNHEDLRKYGIEHDSRELSCNYPETEAEMLVHRTFYQLFKWSSFRLNDVDKAMEIRSKMSGVSAIRYDRDKVQTSPRDRMPEMVDDLIEADKKLARDTERAELWALIILGDMRMAGFSEERQAAVLLYYCNPQCGYEAIGRELGISKERARYLIDCKGKTEEEIAAVYDGIMESLD